MTRDSTVLLVPQKDLDAAKSRVALAPTRRRQLAVAMLRRSLVAATAARFRAVMVVLDNPDDERVFSDLHVTAFHSGLRGLNTSLMAAEDEVRARWGPIPLAVMPADLPFATPDLLDRSLCLAAPYDRAFIPDRSAQGTTLLFVSGDVPLRPAYGPGSAAAHLAQGAHRIDDDHLGPLRHDVDNLDDLDALATANPHYRHARGWDKTA